jgi:hypothetical protein
MTRLILLGTLAISSLSLHGTRYHSRILPYTIEVPLSFRHITLAGPSATQNTDYFFPGLGVVLVNVSVGSLPAPINVPRYLRGLGGKQIHPVGRLTIRKETVPLVGATFTRAVVGRWKVELASFSGCGVVWKLSLSYDAKHKSLRPTMRQMLRSFRLSCPSRRT